MSRDNKAQKSTYSDPKTGYTNRILTMTLQLQNIYKNSSGDEIANVNFFYNIAHVEASDYAH